MYPPTAFQHHCLQVVSLGYVPAAPPSDLPLLSPALPIWLLLLSTCPTTQRTLQADTAFPTSLSLSEAGHPSLQDTLEPHLSSTPLTFLSSNFLSSLVPTGNSTSTCPDPPACQFYKSQRLQTSPCDILGLKQQQPTTVLSTELLAVLSLTCSLSPAPAPAPGPAPRLYLLLS